MLLSFLVVWLLGMIAAVREVRALASVFLVEFASICELSVVSQFFLNAFTDELWNSLAENTDLL